jgi:hypothetical protein
MKRSIAITLLTAALSLVAVGFASAGDCTCSKSAPPTVRTDDITNAGG